MTEQQMIDNYLKTNKVTSTIKQSTNVKVMTQKEYASYIASLKKRIKTATKKANKHKKSKPIVDRDRENYSSVSNTMQSMDESMYNYG